jgi:hypothetical protein
MTTTIPKKYPSPEPLFTGGPSVAKAELASIGDASALRSRAPQLVQNSSSTPKSFEISVLHFLQISLLMFPPAYLDEASRNLCEVRITWIKIRAYGKAVFLFYARLSFSIFLTAHYVSVLLLHELYTPYLTQGGDQLTY